MIGLRRARMTLFGVVCASVIACLAAGGASGGPSPGEPAEGLYVFDPAAGSPMKLVIKGEEDEPGWSPDGRWLVALDTNSLKFNVADSAGGRRHQVGSLAWSNDGSRVAYSPAVFGAKARLLVGPSDWSNPR